MSNRETMFQRASRIPLVWELESECGGWKVWHHRKTGERVQVGPDGSRISLTHDVIAYG